MFMMNTDCAMDALSASGILAYVWLAIVLLAISPNKVEIWEAVLTFLFFPLLILVAFLADKDFCINRKKRQEADFTSIGMSK